MSGIATRTRICVDAVKGTKASITDTRKTAPGLRVIEKYAVRTGGGSNHRFNLADGVLIKDNHIRAAGGITAAVEAARRLAPHTLKIEVEVEDFGMIEEALRCEAASSCLTNIVLRTCKGVRISRAGACRASGNWRQGSCAGAATGWIYLHRRADALVRA